MTRAISPPDAVDAKFCSGILELALKRKVTTSMPVLPSSSCRSCCILKRILGMPKSVRLSITSFSTLSMTLCLAEDTFPARSKALRWQSSLCSLQWRSVSSLSAFISMSCRRDSAKSRSSCMLALWYLSSNALMRSNRSLTYVWRSGSKLT